MCGSSKNNYLSSKIHYYSPKLIYCKKTRIDQNKNKKSSESKTDFIQDLIKINSVFVASICGENETPTKAKRDLNKIYTKFKEYDTYKEVIEDIKTVEINGLFSMVYRRSAND